jgi:hypothetical protein
MRCSLVRPPGGPPVLELELEPPPPQAATSTPAISAPNNWVGVLFITARKQKVPAPGRDGLRI